MVTIKSLQHIGLIVSNAEESAKWYIEKSGFQKKGEFYTKGIKAIFVENERSHVLYELIEHPGESQQAIEANCYGGWVDHIAFEVEDIKKEYEEAICQGMEIIEGIIEIPEFWENGFEYFLVRSPGGEKVEYCKVKEAPL